MKFRFRKFFLILGAAVTVLSVTALAEEHPDRSQIAGQLEDRAEEARDIQAAIQSGASDGDIQKRIDDLKPVDLTALGLPPQQGDGAAASMAGSMYSSDASVQDQFAKLQQELAETSKNQASSGMGEVTRLQTEVSRASSFLIQARQLQKNASDSMSGIAMPEPMKYYMDTSKLSYPKGQQGKLYTAHEWQIIIQSLSNYVDDLSVRMQAALVQVQDFMGNYNNYTQGALSSLQGQNQTLSGIAKGQSLFSQQGGILNTAPIATSAIAGVLIGMLAMWGILKQREKKRLPEKQT